MSPKQPATATVPTTRTNRPRSRSVTVAAEFDAILARIPSIDMAIDHANLFHGAVEVVRAFFSDWMAEDMRLVQCKDGITNKLVRCTHLPSGTDVLVRCYGCRSEVIIDRRQEIINMVCLAEVGLSPPLHGRFRNGLVYGYIPGRVLTSDDMQSVTIGAKVAHELARWHSVTTVPGAIDGPRLFPTLRKWLDGVPAPYTCDVKQAAFVKANLGREMLVAELGVLETHLEGLGSPVGLCHNDLLSGNILVAEDAAQLVSFIDYEYGGYNFTAFDIANHFNEWAGFECDWNRLPTTEQMTAWIRAYVASATTTAANTDLDLRVAEVQRHVCKFMLASHFYWGLWALVQAELSNIDFDYLAYAVLRFRKYFAQKEAYMAL